MVSLPSLKTLKLACVTYLNDDSLRRLLPCCPVLEDLAIQRYHDDNVITLVVTAPSLQRLSLEIGGGCPPGDYEILTPSLKYFKVEDERDGFSYLIEPMPMLEEADINVHENVEKLLESISSVKRFSLNANFKRGEPSVYPDGIVFSRLEHLKLCIDDNYWPKLIFRFLKDSPKLRDFYIYAFFDQYDNYEPMSWKNKPVPKCLLKSLESFRFEGYQGTSGERNFLSFLFKNARCLKSSSILEYKVIMNLGVQLYNHGMIRGKN
ncbi:unnamed protein product [Thlaspi arvense]|uniref:FBD domain-containing protein n=1 Tax=Thlaspi arvense TaxID=13288 RepID=A0AAU9SNX1_THLAR|nr:unnamed protein product [Thlaspi arvense]